MCSRIHEDWCLKRDAVGRLNILQGQCRRRNPRGRRKKNAGRGREGWMSEGMAARGCSGTARVPIATGFQARTRRASVPRKRVLGGWGSVSGRKKSYNKKSFGVLRLRCGYFDEARRDDSNAVSITL